MDFDNELDETLADTDAVGGEDEETPDAVGGEEKDEDEESLGEDEEE